MNADSEVITIPRAEYEHMLERLEDLEDVQAAYDAYNSGTALPSEFAMRIIEDNEHPVRVWREYRGLKQSELAQISGVSGAYISEMMLLVDLGPHTRNR